MKLNMVFPVSVILPPHVYMQPSLLNFYLYINGHLIKQSYYSFEMVACVIRDKC